MLNLMGSLNNKELELKQEVISDFFRSDMAKIHLVIGREESSVYSFLDTSISLAALNKENLVFRYEIWEGENSRHFLYRWLHETVSGKSFIGFGSWPELVNAEPQLMNQLHLLIEQDIRPLEIRFLEAIRFLSRTLKPEKRLILSIVPRTGLHDKVLVDFFQAMLRILPVNVKMVVGQDEEDVLVRQSDFCPSNRLILDGVAGEDITKIREQYKLCCQVDDIKGRLIRIIAHMVHPVGLGLLSELTRETDNTLRKILGSSDLEDLVERDPENRFRLMYPRMFPSVEIDQQDFVSIDKQAVEYFEKRLSDESDHYPNILYHALGLFRIEDTEFVASHTLATYRTKLDMGGGDICELELVRALNLVGDKQGELPGKLLLTLGEVRESRKRNREALDVLNPAIDIFRKIGNQSALQRALEFKGRAAFSIRETDTAKAALEESLSLTQEIGEEALRADILSQLGYLQFSLKQLREAEQLYRESLDLFRSLSKVNAEKGRKGEAAQLSNLGHAVYAKGEFDKAEEYHRKALEMYESLGDRKAAANQWGYLGHTYFAVKTFDQALQAYERAAELEDELGEPKKAAQRHANVGHTMYAQRKVDFAIRSFQKALEKYRELSDPEGEAAQLSNLGLVEGDQGEYKQAVEYFKQAAQIYRELGDAINETIQIVRQGHVRRAEKQYDEAVKHYKDALNRYQTLGYPMGESDTELELGQLYSEKKEWDKAVGCFSRAKAAYTKAGHHEKEALCFILLGHVEQARGQVDSAMTSLRKAMDLYKQVDNSLGVANVASQMGLLLYEQKDFDEAERLYREALEEFRKKKDPEGEANLLSNLGTLYYQTQQLDKARNEFEKALSLLRTIDHPLGISGVLLNLSFVYEKEGKYSDACSYLKEAEVFYEHLHMAKELESIKKRLVTLDQKAEKSLENMRAELFPGLSDRGMKTDKIGTKVGRNDPCPCGSGKKYKKCCGT